MTRYYPLLLQLYPTPESRPRQHEVLIEIYRKGKTDEAFRAFRAVREGLVYQPVWFFLQNSFFIQVNIELFLSFSNLLDSKQEWPTIMNVMIPV